MPIALAAAVGRALAAKVDELSPVAGGDINHAFLARLADGRTCFVKSHPRSPEGMFAAEARGLAWLADAHALRTPQVLAVSSGGHQPAFLVLEHIERGAGRPDFDERLGRGLATLHRAGAEAFGLDHDNFIGVLPQSNAAATKGGWAAFLRERRLEPQLRRAVDNGRCSTALLRKFDRLWAVLDDRVGPVEPPARLHGDLWGGNHMIDERGEPVLIDPACYGGHREVDLAMMRLFGGYRDRVFDAYDEAHRLAADHQQRVPLHQLYPLLVHVNLFGGAYLASVEAALDDLV